jgi:hypothetical protein
VSTFELASPVLDVFGFSADQYGAPNRTRPPDLLIRRYNAPLLMTGRHPGISPGTTVTKMGVSGDGVQQFVDRLVDNDHHILSTMDPWRPQVLVLKTRAEAPRRG